MNDTKILVTGSNGLVGHALKQINSSAMFMTRENCDLTDPAATLGLFMGLRPTQVIHLAAHVGGVHANMAAPATFFRDNMRINLNVFEAARQAGVEKLVCCMSTCVFPDPCTLPLRSEYIHNGPPHPSNYGYAYAKRMLEVMCRAYHQEHNCDFVSVIPSNIYGPHDNFNLDNCHVVPALIRKAYTAKLTGQPLHVWGTGKALREFIFSEDVAELLLKTLTCAYHEPLIFSTGIETSIKELVDEIVAALGGGIEVLWDHSKPEGQHSKPSSNEVLNEKWPGFPFTSLKDGIAETIEWFSLNYTSARIRS